MSAGADLLGNPSITTPAGFILAVLIFIGNQYFRSRQESRTDGEAERSSESGIVETSKATLAVVREQIEQMQEDAREVRVETQKRVREFNRRIDELEAHVERLEDENRDLRRQLGFATRTPYGQQPAIAGYRDEFRGRPVAGTDPVRRDGLYEPTQPNRAVGGNGEEPTGRRHRYRDEG